MRIPLLLVDDDPDACDTTAEMLSAAGYQVDIAPEGTRALQLIEQKSYSLAIIDYQLPGMNGVELFRRLEQRCPNLVGVFLTGHTTLEVVYPAIEAGVVRVLPKPVDFQELLAIIDEQLTAAR
jgi:DNA-binding response OmpR family regulator